MQGPLLTHFERKAPPHKSAGDPRLVRTVSAHVEKHLGRIGWVLHDLISDLIHLDLLWVKPSSENGFHTFVTCGMSERPMNAPPGWKRCSHAELVLRLPDTWKLGHRGLSDERHNWPLMELQHLARLPHVYETWLWADHSVANGDPPEPLPGTSGFSGSILRPLTWADPSFPNLQVDPARNVTFFGVVPLFAEELRLARESGNEVLLERLDRAKVTDLLDVDRPNLGMLH